jgi:nucleotide-binding universal stress UspA family protein
MDHILVAVDGSIGARAATDHAIGLATATGASLTFVSVYTANAALGAPYYQERLTSGLRRARASVDAAVEAAAALDIDADSEIIEGDPAREIVELAERRGFDLLVVGSRGLGTIAGTLLGSVSRWIVQHSHIPVLVVKDAAVQESSQTRATVAGGA